MRLLHASSRKLKWYDDVEATNRGYAILSHTWNDDEVSYGDIQHPVIASQRSGYRKIEYACQQALADGLEYVWVDTCCIDKTSSAELSEAVNAMFSWYRNSSICYAYLEDVACSGHGGDSSATGLAQLPKSRWFTRGWTLQELIAPLRLDFYSQEWTLLGDKQDLCPLLEEITTIPGYVLQNSWLLDTVSIAKKMSRASGRNTSRVEDQAYCLLGLFDVNLPMIYGEGAKAFQRLQEAVIRTSTDQTFLAWTNSSPESSRVLASTPDDFQSAGKLVRHAALLTDPFEMTNAGLRISLPIIYTESKSYTLLDARYEDDFEHLLGVRVDIIKARKSGSDNDVTTVTPLQSAQDVLGKFRLRNLEHLGLFERSPVLVVPQVS